MQGNHDGSTEVQALADCVVPLARLQRRKRAHPRAVLSLFLSFGASATCGG